MVDLVLIMHAIYMCVCERERVNYANKPFHPFRFLVHYHGNGCLCGAGPTNNVGPATKLEPLA